ncbi:MAG: radical SAM protein [Candidatus Jorgensenbacteria bacterium]
MHRELLKTKYKKKGGRFPMGITERYCQATHCYTGETDGFGYAFVPGSSVGVVLLDLRTKQLLCDLNSFRFGEDERRVELLLENKLIELPSVSQRPRALDTRNIKSISIWLHVSNNCNLVCPYCYIIGKDGQYMSRATAKAFLDKLEITVRVHCLKAVTVRIAGGEPTLHKELICFLVSEVRRRFADKGILVKLILITNGTTLNEKWLHLISSASMQLCISLDGVNEWNDRLRFFRNGKGTFDRVMRSIDLCAQLGIRPHILTTITDANIRGIPHLNKFLIDAQLPFRYGVFRDSVGNHTGYQRFSEKAMEVLDDCYDYYARAIRERQIPFAHQFSDIHLDKRTHLRSCSVGFSGITINHLGQAFFCQMQMDKNSLGTVKDKATLLELVWSQRVLPELQGSNVLSYEGCRECHWALVCGGGCPGVNTNACGRATIASPYCDLFRFVIPKLIELKALSLINKHKQTVLNGRR